jgi:hypothetical protein
MWLRRTATQFIQQFTSRGDTVSRSSSSIALSIGRHLNPSDAVNHGEKPESQQRGRAQSAAV